MSKYQESIALSWQQESAPIDYAECERVLQQDIVKYIVVWAALFILFFSLSLLAFRNFRRKEPRLFGAVLILSCCLMIGVSIIIVPTVCNYVYDIKNDAICNL